MGINPSFWERHRETDVVRLFNDLTVNYACSACSVGFVGIDVHCGSELIGNAYNNAIKNEGTSGIELNLNNFLISNAEVICSFGCEVDMSLCSDNAFCEFNGTAGANECASTGAGCVTGFTDGSLYADGSCVCERNFNLRSFSCRTENGHFEFALFTLNSYFFFASKLTGLAKLFLYGKGMTFTEKDRNVFIRKMDVSCGCFNKNLIFHNLKSPFDRITV